MTTEEKAIASKEELHKKWREWIDKQVANFPRIIVVEKMVKEVGFDDDEQRESFLKLMKICFSMGLAHAVTHRVELDEIIQEVHDKYYGDEV